MTANMGAPGAGWDALWQLKSAHGACRAQTSAIRHHVMKDIPGPDFVAAAARVAVELAVAFAPRLLDPGVSRGIFGGLVRQRSVVFARRTRPTLTASPCTRPVEHSRGRWGRRSSPWLPRA